MIESNTVVILKGLPASGKSTWAKEALKQDNVIRINKDELRQMLHNSKFSGKREKFIIKTRNELIQLALNHKLSIIIDDTNLHPKHEQTIKAIVSRHDKAIRGEIFGAHHAEENRYKVIVKEFNVDLDECIERDKHRDNPVGEQVIQHMHDNYISKKSFNKVKPIFRLKQNTDLPKAIICDLDGTLAILNRSPYNPKECMTDSVDGAVSTIIRAFIAQLSHDIILVSGRTDDSRQQTEQWLSTNDIPYDQLYMRKSDDSRKDSIVKQEIYEEFIKDKYYIEFVLDDRKQVVDMWRTLGLKVLQVDEGDF